jgi:hypothetical protein
MVAWRCCWLRCAWRLRMFGVVDMHKSYLFSHPLTHPPAHSCMLLACLPACLPAGEEPHTGIIAGITPGNPTLVTTVEDERLEFQDGEGGRRGVWCAALVLFCVLRAQGCGWGRRAMPCSVPVPVPVLDVHAFPRAAANPESQTALP